MGIKVIDKFTFYNGATPESKSSILKTNILEIINKKIEYCEITDYPYSLKTGLTDIMRRVRMIFAGEYYRLTGRHLGRLDDIPFTMCKHKAKDGELHIYCYFNVQLWDRMIANAKEEKQNDKNV